MQRVLVALAGALRFLGTGTLCCHSSVLETVLVDDTSSNCLFALLLVQLYVALPQKGVCAGAVGLVRDVCHQRLCGRGLILWYLIGECDLRWLHTFINWPCCFTVTITMHIITSIASSSNTPQLC